MLHDPKRSGPGRIEELQFEDPDISYEAPIRIWTRHQLTGNERATTEKYRGPVGKTRRDRQGTKCENWD